MKNLIEKITPAIIESHKIHVELNNGNRLVVHPHIVVRKRKGEEILKTMLDGGGCLDIPLQRISSISILPESFAIETSCLNFDHREYELVFPRKEDLLRFSLSGG
ncbi:MAG TPA: hypothetical protein VF490_02680 [Chryseosolibacter sp.]